MSNLVDKKICSKCHQEKSLEKFYKNKTKKDGYSFWCKSCHNARHKQYYEANKGKIAVWEKQYREINKDKIAQYHEANKDKMDAWRKQYGKILTETLDDKYIRQRLSLKGLQVPQQLIEVKRLHLQIFRHLKEAQA